MEQFRASLARGLTLIDVHSHPAADATALSRFTKEGKNLFGSAPFPRAQAHQVLLSGQDRVGNESGEVGGAFFRR